MNEENQKHTGLIAVTGVSGHLGRLVVESLLADGIQAERIVAVVREPEKIADLAARGIEIRRADYAQPATLEAAFKGVERLLLVSSNQLGERASQHENVAAAARKAGVSFLAYTSILKADTTGIKLAAEHLTTEEIIRESGIDFAFLRNGWYHENYTDQIAQTIKHGAIFGSAGDGKVSAASRADYAAAAAAVLTGAGHENKTYELGGDTAFTLNELATEIAKQSDREIAYRELPVEEFAQALIGAGLPEPMAHVLADADLGIKRGDLYTESRDLSRLINRPTTALADAVTSALK